MAKIYASTRAEEVALTGWPPDQQSAFLNQQFEAQRAHFRLHYPDALWLVVMQGLAPVGRLYLEDWPSQVRVIDIAILPDFRGRGFGAALLEDVAEMAAHRGLDVSIHVERTNRARGLYRRLGFEEREDAGVYDLWVRPAQAKTAS